jgi:type IV pilus assembly protein PilB
VDYDLRLSIYVTVHRECLVMRILSKQMGLVSLNKLGMDPPLMKSFRRQVLDIPTGVVIITAPTGEGKTTTLYSCLDQINDMSVKIITAEDPVEYRLDGIIQCAIYPKAGRTFETTLREIVRQDPDIVVLGEIRDTTTAKFAVQTAVTGHKVYCTFHTEDSVAALIRLMNMQIETFLIASTVLSILAQRLLRRICTDCAVPHVPTLDELQALGVDPAEIRQFEIKRGKGCAECNYTGYRGRVAVFESLVMNDAIRDAIAQRQPASAIREITYATTDILSMREDALAKCKRRSKSATGHDLGTNLHQLLPQRCQRPVLYALG